MTDAVERQPPKASVQKLEGQNRIAVVEDTAGTVAVGDIELIPHAQRLMLQGEELQLCGVQIDLISPLVVALQLAIHQNALAEFPIVAVKTGAAQECVGFDRNTVAALLLDLGTDVGDHLLHGKERNPFRFGRQRQRAARLGKDHHAVDAPLDLIDVLKTTDELIGGSHRAFQGLVDTVFLVLIETVALHADLTLPVFDLQNEWHPLVDDHKVLFQKEILVRHHHVAEDAVKILTQDPIDRFFPIRAKELDLLGCGQTHSRVAMKKGFDGIGHRRSPRT